MISFKAGVLATAPIHRSNAVISCCCKLSTECNRERVRDKQGGDKERQSIRGGWREEQIGVKEKRG